MYTCSNCGDLYCIEMNLQYHESNIVIRYKESYCVKNISVNILIPDFGGNCSLYSYIFISFTGQMILLSLGYFHTITTQLIAYKVLYINTEFLDKLNLYPLDYKIMKQQSAL